EVVLKSALADILEMPGTRIPALARYVAARLIALITALLAYRPAAIEVQVVLNFARAHALEMPRARIPAFLCNLAAVVPSVVAVAAGAVAGHRPAAIEVQVVLDFT